MYDLTYIFRIYNKKSPLRVKILVNCNNFTRKYLRYKIIKVDYTMHRHRQKVKNMTVCVK